MLLKKIVALGLLIGFSVLIGEAWYLARDGLVIRRILAENISPFELGWDGEAKLALTQKFYSVGRGRQCYAFISEDKKYCLKIPRYDRFRAHFWSKPEEARKLAFINSLHLAFNELKEETALVGIRFPGEKGKTVTLVDRLGRSYHLPQERTGFILQYRKNLLSDALKKVSLDTLLDRMVKVIADRSRKGIACRDDAFFDNFGFDETGGYQIDVGSFFRPEGVDSKTTFEQSMISSLRPIQKWLETIDPILYKTWQVGVCDHFLIQKSET